MHFQVWWLLAPLRGRCTGSWWKSRIGIRVHGRLVLEACAPCRLCAGPGVVWTRALHGRAGMEHMKTMIDEGLGPRPIPHGWEGWMDGGHDKTKRQRRLGLLHREKNSPRFSPRNVSNLLNWECKLSQTVPEAGVVQAAAHGSPLAQLAGSLVGGTRRQLPRACAADVSSTTAGPAPA